jgi:hypothetical protein
VSEPPKASAAGPELSSNTQGGERADWRRWLLLVGTVVVGVVVATIAVTAWLHLRSTGAETDWTPIYQEVLKTSFAALAVGALGGMAKLLFDQRKARDAAATELRDRRYRFISTLIEVIYDIETAKLIIRANRSVRSWTDMVNERIVPGCSRLADMAQQLINWADAGLPVFDDTEGVAADLEGMNRYFASLLAEYGDNKQALSELQLKAEAARRTRREQLLTQIWQEMRALNVLGGLISHPHDDTYSTYRSNYAGALLKMRRSLVPKTLRNRQLTVGSARVTTPWSSGPR